MLPTFVAKISSGTCSKCDAQSSLCDRAKAEVFDKSDEIEISENIAVSLVNRLSNLWRLTGILQDLLHFLHEYLVASSSGIFRSFNTGTWEEFRSITGDKSTKEFWEYVHAV
jgi:hypothetical protein